MRQKFEFSPFSFFFFLIADTETCSAGILKRMNMVSLRDVKYASAQNFGKQGTPIRATFLSSLSVFGRNGASGGLTNHDYALALCCWRSHGRPNITDVTRCSRCIFCSSFTSVARAS